MLGATQQLARAALGRCRRRIPERAATRRADAVGTVEAGMWRRVWDLIPLGYEVDMLWLHLKTLEPVVDGFLVTEATTTHTGDEPKPTFVHDALKNGTVPSTAIAQKLRVRVVEFAAERRRFCPNAHSRCYEALQRFLLLEMLFEVAAPQDLALVNDVDEFAKPSVVSMLKHCYPFDDSSMLPSFVTLRLTLYKFGVHCDHGNSFELGTRAFSVHALKYAYGHQSRVSPAKREAMSADFTQTRSRPLSGPTVPNAGWHLTSFGDPENLSRKLRTFLHSNIFNGRDRVARGSLQVPRLERCMRHCLELDKPTPVPPCLSRNDRTSRPLPGIRRTEISTADLPRTLVNHRATWPTAWFRFLDES